MPIEIRPLNIPANPGFAGLNPLEARVAALEAQVAALMSVMSVGPAGGVTISSPGALRLSAATVEMNAGMVRTPGVIHCNTVIAQLVNGVSYTPGAGNMM